MKNILKEKRTKSGKKIILKTPSPSDATNMINYFNVIGGESDYLLFGKNEFRFSLEDEKKHIEKINADVGSCIIIGLIDNHIVTCAQLIRYQRERIAHNGSLSISVKKEYWGEGIATIVLDEIIKYAKLCKKIRNIKISVNSENIRAISLYVKFGFKKIGVHKNSLFVNGTYYDEILMDLVLY
mgnify:CR=1 FL=1